MASIDKIKIGDSTYDITTSWSSITNKPSSFTPANHTHTKAEVGLGNVDNTADANKSVKYATTAGSANSVTWTNVSNKPNTFPPDSHNHDGRYLRWNGSSADTNNMGWGTLTSTNGYTVLSHASSSDGGDWGMVNKDGKIFMQLDGYYYQNEGLSRVLDTSDSSSFAAASHTHDDRYYTKSEMNSKLNGKANSSHTHSYLPLDGSSAMTGALDLKNSANGIKFNSKNHYMTNIQVGSASINLSSSSGSTNSSTVTFHDESKGNGSWYIVTTVNSSTTNPESVISCVDAVTSRGFTIKIKRIASVGGGSPMVGVDYIAIKFS